MSDDPQQEYAAARAAYQAAMVRLQEAKRHIPPSPRDRLRQRKREEREAARAHYLANKEAIDAEDAKMERMITAKTLAILHQQLQVNINRGPYVEDQDDEPNTTR